MRKGFTLLEIAVVILLVSILVTLAVTVFQDYTKRSRAAELPPLLKSIVDVQMAYKTNPDSGGEFASSLISLAWTTSSGGTSGKYYDFGTSGVDGCHPGTAADPLPIGLAEAWAINDESVLITWRSGCMTQDHAINTNSP